MTDEELKYFIALQPVFKKKMGELKNGDSYAIISPSTGIHICQVVYSKLNNNCIRLPLPIDPDNPERGLLGMINFCIGFDIDGHVGCLIQTAGEQYKRIYGDTFTLALLKALAAQEGIKV